MICLEKYTYEDLLQIMRKLLSENGCPWDKEQTHESLRQYLIEECYEVIDAVDKKDYSALCEELGDVLLQVVFHSIIAEKGNTFTIDDVVDGICKKMVYRHPHIFSDISADTSNKVLENWEKLKKKEKGYKNQTEVLKSVPDCLPALMKAQKIQKKAADVGFDFPDLESAMQKVYEELDEVKRAIGVSKEKEMEEIGDLLFSIVNISRFLKINSEFSLTNASKKFINRFERVEHSLIKEGVDIKDATSETLDDLWIKSKGQ